MEPVPLSRAEASAAADRLGWRYVLGALRAAVPTPSLAAAAALAAEAAQSCGEQDGHLAVQVRRERLDLVLCTPQLGAVTDVDVRLAQTVSRALDAQGADLAGSGLRPQALEIAIDALEIPKVRPFWAAVLGYLDEPGGGETGALVDPSGQGPTVWFQQMQSPRSERNRVHIDVSVTHDEADARVAAALRAGGTLVSGRAARAFWVLADAEGNEACVCTWQDRDAGPEV